MRIASGFMLAVLLSCSLAAQSAHAQDGPKEREIAANRYLSVVPMAKLMEDMTAEMANQLPIERRQAFIDQMRGLVRVDALERIARDAMVRTFTVDELNALADFYGSKYGTSAMKKFGAYLQLVMPALVQEMQRAAQQVKPSKT